MYFTLVEQLHQFFNCPNGLHHLLHISFTQLQKTVSINFLFYKSSGIESLMQSMQVVRRITIHLHKLWNVIIRQAITSLQSNTGTQLCEFTGLYNIVTASGQIESQTHTCRCSLKILHFVLYPTTTGLYIHGYFFLKAHHVKSILTFYTSAHAVRRYCYSFL